jgi:hypothetical protein
MALGIYPRTKEHNKHISEALTGKILSKEHRQQIINSKKGKHPINSYPKGHIPWNKGKKGVYSKETLTLMAKPKIGKKHTDETKKKLSIAHMGRIPWNKNKHGM